MDREAADLMAEKGIWLVPTLGESYIIAHRGLEYGRPEWLVQKCQEEIDLRGAHYQHAVDAGVKLAVGTDVIGTMAEEMVLMAAGGVSNNDIITAATRNGAEVCNLLDQTGTLESGKWADVLVIDGNPLEDLGVMANVRYVFKEGHLYCPEQLLSVVGKTPL